MIIITRQPCTSQQLIWQKQQNRHLNTNGDSQACSSQPLVPQNMQLEQLQLSSMRASYSKHAATVGSTGSHKL